MYTHAPLSYTLTHGIYAQIKQVRVVVCVYMRERMRGGFQMTGVLCTKSHANDKVCIGGIKKQRW